MDLLAFNNSQWRCSVRNIVIACVMKRKNALALHPTGGAMQMLSFPQCIAYVVKTSNQSLLECNANGSMKYNGVTC